MIYLAEKSGKLLSPDPRKRYETLQWLMFQMGGLGPFLGQLNHFVKFAKEKVPYAIERYTTEGNRLMGVLNGRLRAASGAKRNADPTPPLRAKVAQISRPYVGTVTVGKSSTNARPQVALVYRGEISYDVRPYTRYLHPFAPPCGAIMAKSLTPYFDNIPTIKYEGPETDNPLAYRYFDAKAKILGKPMKDWMRNAVCYWHTFRGVALDIFGPGTIFRPWEDGTNSLDMALKRTDVVFDFITKLGVEYYCFHDRDVSPEGANVSETNSNLWAVAEKLKSLQKATGVKLLWGTANMFSHPRFAQGASTSPNADVFAYCANSVKEMLDVTKYLAGENYVFWGGREGYNTLLNTDMGREADHAAKFFQMAVDYAKKIGFKGQFLIEPKACEPTKHQYDFDSATVLAFLRKYGLEKHFKLNVEQNHATLAGHDFCHELAVCAANGALGSIDSNRGDVMNGWDTDQFPNDYRECAQAWTIILKDKKGMGTGGLNYDAKVRRDSHDVEDMFFAHICGIDTWARGLRIAEKIIKDGKMESFVDERYSSYDSGVGRTIERGTATFESLQKYIIKKGEVAPTPSARQEYLENLLNKYC